MASFWYKATTVVAMFVALVSGVQFPAPQTGAPVPAVAEATAATAATTTVTEGGPLRILAVGDSITCGGLGDTPGWCPELSRLLGVAQVDHVITPWGVGGSLCSSWPAVIAPLLVEFHPDIVILGCGHNDAASQTPPATTQAAVQAIAAQVHAAGARLLLNRVHYASGNPASWEPRPWLPAAIEVTNGGLVAAWNAVTATYGLAFSPAMADDTRVPPLSKYILGDGVHPTTRGANVPLTHATSSGYDVLAHNRYRALAAGFLVLPAIGWDCMQIGHAPSEPAPRSFPCYGSPS